MPCASSSGIRASGLSVYHWEGAKARPRKQQVAKLVAVRGIGKREAMKRLEIRDGLITVYLGEVERDDLIVQVEERPDGLSITFTYNTDLFDENTIDQMLAHYRDILEALPLYLDRHLRA